METLIGEFLGAVPTLAFALVIVWLWLQSGAQNKEERTSRDMLWQDFFAMQRELDRSALAALVAEISLNTAAVSGMQAVVSDCEARRTVHR